MFRGRPKRQRNLKPVMMAFWQRPGAASLHAPTLPSVSAAFETHHIQPIGLGILGSEQYLQPAAEGEMESPIGQLSAR